VPLSRILFLCGGLQPGADGVGDYTRTLAEELRRLGADVAICAVSDRHTAALEKTESPLTAIPHVLPTLRLPYTLSWSEKKRAIQSWLGQWMPSTVSLQYVPYSFNPRGIPFGLARWLRSTFAHTVNWHIMFHEIWVGISRRSPWKHHLVGALQRRVAQALVSTLAPTLCHTSNALYVTILGDAGINATRLPLFSNIPVVSNESPWMKQELATLGITPDERSRWWVVGMFGSCYPDIPLAKLAQNLQSDAEKRGQRLAFLGMGGGVGTGASWEQRIRTAVPSAVVRHFGRQSDARVSAFLSALDHGLPNTPRQFVGKSSATAAIVAHGVPLDTRYEPKLPEYDGRWQSEIQNNGLFQSVSKSARSLFSQLNFH
jgi:Glycosyl transferase 4-like domain